MASWTQVVSVLIGLEGIKKKEREIFFLQWGALTLPPMILLHPSTAICVLPWTPTAMMNEPKLHSITPKVRRRRNNGNWPQQCGADPQHSSQQFSLISINSFPIHHTPQET